MKVFPISAPINYGVEALIKETAQMLSQTEDDIETFEAEYDFSQDDDQVAYRKVHVSRDGDAFVLKGQQLDKIFNSTNFNDIGSLRYLYKYIETSGAMEVLREMGLEEGDTIRINDFEFDYIEEY